MDREKYVSELINSINKELQPKDYGITKEFFDETKELDDLQFLKAFKDRFPIILEMMEIERFKAITETRSNTKFIKDFIIAIIIINLIIAVGFGLSLN
ncbi:MAG: hypothetical protein LAT81_14785 [Oceanicaulis sp.]|nr:hypothetical protein [Oceanicaulis sp.]